MAGMLVAATHATFNFKSTCGTANNQMSSLNSYLMQVKAIADRNGHVAISAKCNEAARHLIAARTSWNFISTKFGRSPWEARSSSDAGLCQTRLSSCGASIDWIRSRPEVNRFPAYRVPLSNCWTGHRSTQSTCGQVWKWPCPPGYNKPKPSGSFRRKARDASKTLCPNPSESACPISANSTSYECLNTNTEMYSCGGCATNKLGENCYEIDGANTFGCEAGVCRVYSALPGWKMSPLTGRPVRA